MTLHRWTIRWDERLGDLGGYRVSGTEPFPDAPVAVVRADEVERSVEAERAAIVDDLRYGRRGLGDLVGPQLRNAIADRIASRGQS